MLLPYRFSTPQGGDLAGGLGVLWGAGALGCLGRLGWLEV